MTLPQWNALLARYGPADSDGGAVYHVESTGPTHGLKWSKEVCDECAKQCDSEEDASRKEYCEQKFQVEVMPVDPVAVLGASTSGEDGDTALVVSTSRRSTRARTAKKKTVNVMLSSKDDIETARMKIWQAMESDVQPSSVVIYNGTVELSAGTLASCGVLLNQHLRVAIDTNRIGSGDGDADAALAIALSGSVANRKEEAGFRGTLLGSSSNAHAPAVAPAVAPATATNEIVANNIDVGDAAEGLGK